MIDIFVLKITRCGGWLDWMCGEGGQIDPCFLENFHYPASQSFRSISFVWWHITNNKESSFCLYISVFSKNALTIITTHKSFQLDKPWTIKGAGGIWDKMFSMILICKIHSWFHLEIYPYTKKLMFVTFEHFVNSSESLEFAI